MSLDAPISHVEDALSLTGDREVDLFTITLRDKVTTFHIRNGPSVTWRGVTYENLPIMLTGVSDTADDTNNRPTLRAFNPNKIFGPFAQQGLFELGIVQRQTVLQRNLLANADIKVTRVWLIARITTLTSQAIEAELRKLTDGPNMNVPARSYNPPDFPSCSF